MVKPLRPFTKLLCTAEERLAAQTSEISLNFDKTMREGGKALHRASPAKGKLLRRRSSSDWKIASAQPALAVSRAANFGDPPEDTQKLKLGNFHCLII